MYDYKAMYAHAFRTLLIRGSLFAFEKDLGTNGLAIYCRRLPDTKDVTNKSIKYFLYPMILHEK